MVRCKLRLKMKSALKCKLSNGKNVRFSILRHHKIRCIPIVYITLGVVTGKFCEVGRGIPFGWKYWLTPFKKCRSLRHCLFLSYPSLLCFITFLPRCYTSVMSQIGNRGRSHSALFFCFSFRLLLLM